MSAIASYNVDGLEQLIKALGQRKPPKARVGILGDGDTRKDGKSQAEIGAAHEFGAPRRGIPPRSFLRMPIANGLFDEMKRSGLFDKAALAEVVKAGTVEPWLKLVAGCAEKCVADAFASGGPGWPKWKDPNYTNNTGMLLVDTTQLRDSIKSEVG